MFELYNKCYKKKLPGAICLFQPDDLAEYKSDSWDIRVSIGDALLEEAFYITIKDPKAINKSIRELLDEYVLNIELQHELDIADYPELPFLQQQLIEYFKSVDSGRLKLDIFVNNNPRIGPISTLERAKTLLGSCVYDDHSYDYCVLDLIILPRSKEVEEYNKNLYLKKYSEIFLLLLLSNYIDNQQDYLKLCTESSIGYFLGNFNNKNSVPILNGLKKLKSNGFIAKVSQDEESSVTNDNKFKLIITETGYEKISEVNEEIENIMNTYNYFDSVSISPPALGVPEGFDVRVQMMEYDRIDVERAVFLCVLADCYEELFQLESWEYNFLNASFMNNVIEALAFRTSFLPEVLVKLRSFVS